MRPKYSIVAPFFNEQEVLPEFYKRVKTVMDGLDGSVELVLINDGSTDDSLSVARKLYQQDPSRIRIVSLSRNFGHQIAISAGIDNARGNAIVIIDTDLQDPPEVIPELVAAWKRGCEVVYAIREQRKGESWFKLVMADLFYRLIRRLTSVNIPQNAGDFRLIDRKVVLVLQQMREHHRFVRGLTAWVGFRSIGIKYVRHGRHAGKSKYLLFKMIGLAKDAVAGFSYLPLQVATNLGFVIIGIVFVIVPTIVVLRWLGNDFLRGQATILISTLFIAGVQLIFLGVIGEYLGRIYDEVKNRPLYIVDEMIQKSEGKT